MTIEEINEKGGRVVAFVPLEQDAERIAKILGGEMVWLLASASVKSLCKVLVVVGLPKITKPPSLSATPRTHAAIVEAAGSELATSFASIAHASAGYDSDDARAIVQELKAYILAMIDERDRTP